MPFKSEAQRRKFYALKAEGKMDQKTIDEWESETKGKLPERIKKAFKQSLEGGLADDKKPSDFPKDQMRKGIKVEMEHTNDPAKAKEITMDHLAEDLKYYDKLEKMEKEAMGLSKVAKNTATKTDPAKWEAAKREAKSKMGGKHSARAMQLATQIYKKKGGGYSGSKPSSKNSLKKWQKEDWQPNPSGKRPKKGIAQDSKGRTTRYLPKKKWDSLSSKERVATDKKKKKGSEKGQQFVANTRKARVKTDSVIGLEKIAKSNFHTDKPLYQPRPSTRAGKKYMVYVKNGSGGKKLIHFGATGYKHNYSPEAKKNFRARHNCDSAQKDTPKWWACNYLWNKKQDIGSKTYEKAASVNSENFRGGFLKIADNLDPGERVLGSMMLGTAISAAGGPLLTGLMQILDKPYKGNEEKFEKIISEFNKANPDNNVAMHVLPEGADNAFYAIRDGDAKPFVGAAADASESTIRHELGHAKNYERFKSNASKVKAIGIRNSLLGLGVLGSLGALAHDDEDVRDKAWISTAVGGAPVYLDEGLASARAAKNMIQTKGFVEGLKRSAQLVPAFGTYLLPLAGAYAASKLFGKSDKTKKKEKKSKNKKKAA